MADSIYYLKLVVYAVKCTFLIVMFYLASKAFYAKDQKVTMVLYLFMYYIFVMILFAVQDFFLPELHFNYYVVTFASMGQIL